MSTEAHASDIFAAFSNLEVNSFLRQSAKAMGLIYDLY